MCTGSLVLAAAGLLTGLTAATHWRATELLESLGAVYAPQRVVEHLPQRIITAAGVSSGIDMALRLVELLVDRDAAQAAQLMIEYDPQPPFDAGAVAKASAATRERAREYYGELRLTRQRDFARSAGVPVTLPGCRRRRPSCHGYAVAATTIGGDEVPHASIRNHGHP